MYLHISADGLKAFFNQRQSAGETKGIGPFFEGHGTDAWRNKLKEAGVIFGLDESALEYLSYTSFSKLKADQDYIIAVGREPTPQGGYEQTWHFEFASSKPPKDDSNNPDYKNRNFGIDVFEGQLLAEQTYHKDGLTGMDVFGKSVPSGRDNSRSTSPIRYEGAVYIEKTGMNTRYLSRINGVLYNNQLGVVAVQPSLEIRESVNLEVGNLSSQHPIIIRKDVCSGFFVRSGTLVEIHGSVDPRAVVESRGDIVVRGGAARDSVLKAQGSIELRFGQGSKISCEKNLTVAQYLFDCRVSAKGKVLCPHGSAGERRGAVVGGCINALLGMELSSVGSATALTELIAGFHLEELHRLNEQGAHLSGLKLEIGRTLRRLDLDIFEPKLLERINQLPAQRRLQAKQLLKHFLELRGLLTKQVKELKDENERFHSDQHQDAKIVLGDLYPDVLIRMGKKNKLVTSSLSRVEFHLEEGKIVTKLQE